MEASTSWGIVGLNCQRTMIRNDTFVYSEAIAKRELLCPKLSFSYL